MEEQLIKNTSKIYYNGSIWKSNNFGKFKIVGKINKIDSRGEFRYFLIEFEDGTRIIAKNTHIFSGNVKNPNQPVIFGLGYIGVGKWKSRDSDGKKLKLYDTWLKMLSRCYNPKNSQYIAYGWKGVIVEEWLHNFQNYCNHVIKLDNFDKWINNIDTVWCIDKDVLSKDLGLEVHIYSRLTLKIITTKENNSRENREHGMFTGNTYIGIHPEEGIIEFKNKTEIAERYGLDKSCISKVVYGSQKSHKGWIFKIKECGQNEV